MTLILQIENQFHKKVQVSFTIFRSVFLFIKL